jgi:N-acetylglucosamine-6-phosphate deacetylase
MIRKPEKPMLSLMTEYGKNVVRLCTLAPEHVLQKQLEQLNNGSIRISAGHSAIDCTRARRMFQNGIGMATHLFNGMEPLLGRAPGLVGAIYLEKPWTGIIADGVHVAWDNVILAKEILQEKLLLITDATPAVGSDNTQFGFGGQTVYVREGKCVAADGTIGGSLLTMDQAVRNCVQHANIPVDEALRMASLYPAQAIGVDTQYGRIARGYRADLVALSPRLEVVSVFKQGIRQTLFLGKKTSALQA